MKTFASITLADALELQAHLLEVAAADGDDRVAICVVDARGWQLSAATMDGVDPTTVGFALAKAATAVYSRRDTVCLRHAQNDAGRWLLEHNPSWSQHDITVASAVCPTFCAWAGGVVVLSPHDGIVVGGIGVSGRSELADHQLASQRPPGWSQ